MPLPSYEKLGAFYLGREYDPATQQLGDELLYDSRDLTTHAVCIGMTGSGKTGLCVSLLEEAAIDGVPAIVIDPKGDIANLALTFPQLRPEDFKPWVDAGEASRKGQSVDEFAAATAATWRQGLEEWGQDGERIQRLRDAAVVDIYTPGSNAGRPLSILGSFAAPDPVVASDATALKERVSSAVAGLLGLLGIDADPIRSREFILLSALLDAAWRNGESLDLAALIRSVQKPPFDNVGVFDVESFFPAKDRMELALRINALLASPGFEAWLAGDALDIQSLLYDASGKPRISIISIAHLNDAERMFVVTLVTNELVAWMRRQSGTTSLRAIFYMDEVFGFFPPSAMPPSKLPMLTLMKQARAFGLGVVLATQNPVDLDYKGLGNAGTWFIGRLQTERDKARVIEGLLGSDSAGGMDKAQLEAAMSSLPQRTFLMRNVHDAAPVLLRTRWALSYLRGPLTSAEIARLAASEGKESTPPAPAAVTGPARAATSHAPAKTSGSRPIVPAGVPEKFMAAAGNQGVEYEPRIGARVRAHFVDTRAGLDAWENWYYLAPLTAQGPDWDAAEICNADAIQLLEVPAPHATFADVTGGTIAGRALARHGKSLADHVYRTSSLSIMRCPDLKLTSAPGGSEGEFRARVALALREKRDAAVDALRRKYASKLDTIEDRARKAEQKLVREKEQSSQQTMSSALSVGGSLLGALFGGRRSSAFGKASSAAKSVGRIGKERTDVAHAEADLTALQQQHAALEAELADEIAALESKFDAGAIAVEQSQIKARKSDTEVTDLALVWQPA
ncbi:MAG: ATP-binding protein [Proteobacteria bacterium]|nr:ATP-binding protein [Pseudomonadota bacterium]